MSSISPQSTTVSAMDLGLSLGPFLIAVLISTALWGALSVQTIYYFMHYPRDKASLKFVAGFSWCIATIHDILIIKGVWRPLIQSYGDFPEILSHSPEFGYQIPLTAIAGLMTQTYFMRRIYQFGGISGNPIFASKIFKYGFPILLAPVIAFQFVGLVTYAALKSANPAEAAIAKSHMLVTAVICCVAAVDIVIAFVTCVMLYQSKNGFSGTNKILSNLMMVSLNSGAWTSLFAITTVINSMVHPTTSLFAMTDLSLCGLYLNTIMGNLNARTLVLNGASEHEGAMSTFKVDAALRAPRKIAPWSLTQDLSVWDANAKERDEGDLLQGISMQTESTAAA